MSEPKFTKGPWKATYDSQLQALIEIYNTEDRTIVAVLPDRGTVDLCEDVGGGAIMREILFRGQVKGTNIWVFGALMEYRGGAVAIWETPPSSNDGFPEPTQVNPETVGQYTGLKDKNGIKIFEGDILKDERAPEGKLGIVEYWDNIASFVAREGDTFYKLNNDNPTSPAQLEFTEVVGYAVKKEAM